jgi:hypothetical protein
VLLPGTTDGRATRDRPPPAHTGGFGEPTCQECHFEADVGAGPGSLVLEGLPDAFVPGTAYTLTLTLAQPRMRAGGYQLAARFEEGGRQAGSFAVPDAESRRSDLTMLDGVQYAHHVADGTATTAPDTARWTVVWLAPAELGAVLFHAAANAADDDSSPLGDYIYTLAASVR